MQGQPPARQKSASPAAAESAATPTYTIGQLAALAGLPVKTIRFYSDSGVLPASRSPAGHRRYAEDALARLHLVRSLRDLDLDLPTIKHVLEGRRDLSGVLAAHVAALETRIQALRRQVVVLRAVAGHPDEAALRRVHQLWRLDATERRQLLERFWDQVAGNLPAHHPGAQNLRIAGVPDLPDAPSPDQLDAWLELAALAGDEDFQRTTAANATWYWEQLRPDYRGSAHAWEVQTSPLIQAAAAAREAGRAPSGDEGRALAGAYAAACAVAFGRDDGLAFRAWLLEQIDAHTDPRAGRYWELVGKLRGAADRKDPVPQAPATAPDAAGVANLGAADHAATSSGDPASLSPRRAAAAHAWLVEALRSKVQMERAT